MNAATMSLNATPRGSPIPKLGNILHSTDQTASSPAPFQAGHSSLPPAPHSPLEVVSPSLWEQTGSSPKPEVSLNIFEPMMFQVPHGLLGLPSARRCMDE